MPPETEASHFVHVLEPYAQKHGMPFAEFVDAYNHHRVDVPELDEYFLHDRAVRESGHDTSYRLEKVCANLATVNLNSLLYKYEMDIARVIRTFFNDKLVIPGGFRVRDQKEGHFETLGCVGSPREEETSDDGQVPVERRQGHVFRLRHSQERTQPVRGRDNVLAHVGRRLHATAGCCARPGSTPAPRSLRWFYSPAPKSPEAG